MNKVQLNLNSYAQSAQILINGREPSVYSDLANYTYRHFSTTPDVILDAVARELNDDFMLTVCGNLFEYSLYSAAASQNSYCIDCKSALPEVRISSRKRAEHLANIITPKDYHVAVINSSVPTEPLRYGSRSIWFTNESVSVQDLQFQITSCTVVIDLNGAKIQIPRSMFSSEVLLSACETYLINPAIGQAVAGVNNPTKDIAVCSRLTPILVADIPTKMECGAEADVRISAYPCGDMQADVVVKASNPDIISVSGLTLSANNPGNTMVEVFNAGENKPFHSQQVVVSKTIYASTILVEGLDDTLNEDAVIPLQVKVVPADAIDASDIKWTTSDPAIALVKDGNLITRGSGTCIIRVQTSHAKTDVKVTVSAKLRCIELSETEINTSVGRKVPLSVRLVPENVFNSKYCWNTSDDSVAIVINEDGQDFIKAVGIGDCTISCISEDGSIKKECYVNVESLMYKKQKKTSFKPFILIAIVLLGLFVFKLVSAPLSEDIGDPYLINANSDKDSHATTESTSFPYCNDSGFLTDPSYITQEIIDELAAHAISLQTERNNSKNGGFTYSEVTFCCATFSRPAENSSFFNYENSIDIFITYEGIMDGYGTDVHHVYYTPIHYKNITVNDDGTLNIVVDDGVFASYFTNDLESAIEHLSDSGRYVVTRIE